MRRSARRSFVARHHSLEVQKGVAAALHIGRHHHGRGCRREAACVVLDRGSSKDYLIYACLGTSSSENAALPREEVDGRVHGQGLPSQEP